MNDEHDHDWGVQLGPEGAWVRWCKVDGCDAREVRNLDRYVMCRHCGYERKVGQGCGLPCV